MKKQRPLLVALSVFLVVNAIPLLACDPNNVEDALERECVGDECLNLPKFSQNIQDALNGTVVGYQLVVGHGLWNDQVVSGEARTSTDAPATAMSFDQNFNLASVSKTITAVAVMQSLDANSLTPDSVIGPYLPSTWTRGANVDDITFRELMTHTSGIRHADPNAVFLADLEATVAGGINLADKTEQYQNQNFALFRVLVPYLNGFDDGGASPDETAIANAFLGYVLANVLTPTISTDASCSPDPDPHLLYYPFPDGGEAGGDFGDWLTQCGSGGFHLDATDLWRFVFYWTETDSLVSEALRDEMLSGELGTNASAVKNATAYSHGGYLYRPATSGRKELNTYYVAFPDLDTQVILLVNSETPTSLGALVMQAYDAAWEPK